MSQTTQLLRPAGASARDRHPLPRRSLFDPAILRPALADAVRKLPRGCRRATR